ncbi:Type II secretion system (T2SS), protein M [compost metagenome]
MGAALERLSPRERRAVFAAAWVVGLGLLWWLALAPALSTLRQAPERHARLDTQLAQMQQLAASAEQLRAQLALVNLQEVTGDPQPVDASQSPQPSTGEPAPQVLRRDDVLRFRW